MNNGWNSGIEKSINRLGEIASTYSDLHTRCSIFYNYVDVILGFASGFITIITGILSTIPEYSEKGEKVESQNIIYTCLLFTSSGINFIQQYLGFSKESLKHSESSKKYKILHNDIIIQLTVYKKDRERAQDYILNVATDINKIIFDSPLINPFISWYYYKNKKAGLETVNIHSANNQVISDFFDSDTLRSLPELSEPVIVADPRDLDILSNSSNSSNSNSSNSSDSNLK